MTGRLAALGITAVSLVATLSLPTPAPADFSPGPGRINFVRNATSAFTDELLAAEQDPVKRGWMQDHYASMRAYPPFFTWHTFEGNPPWQPPPADFYKDAYAIYRDYDPAFPLCDEMNPSPGSFCDDYGELSDDQRLICEHPDWVLRDSPTFDPPTSCTDGEAIPGALYINDSCSDATPACPQFAADISNPGFRQYWIQGVTKTLTHGYRGLFIDDVDLMATQNTRISDANGTEAPAIYDHQGQLVSDADWQQYMATFLEEIRAAFPSIQITHNTLWDASNASPCSNCIERSTAAADVLEKERGFNDQIDGGSDIQGQRWTDLAGWIDNLHQQGASFLLEPYNLDPVTVHYEVANYFLFKHPNRDDAVASDYYADQANRWFIWDFDMGQPVSPRWFWTTKGVWRRDYENGIVIVNPEGDGGSSHWVPFEVPYDGDIGNQWGGNFTGLNFQPGEGAVLRRTQPRNLISNWSFESNLSGWTVDGAIGSRVQRSDAPDGAYVALVDKEPGVSYYRLRTAPPTVSSTVAGLCYTASVSVRRASSETDGRQLAVYIREKNPGGVTVSTTYEKLPLSDAFQTLSVSHQAEADGNQIDTYLKRPPTSSGTLVSGEKFYADALSLTAGPCT